MIRSTSTYIYGSEYNSQESISVGFLCTFLSTSNELSLPDWGRNSIGTLLISVVVIELRKVEWWNTTVLVVASCLPSAVSLASPSGDPLSSAERPTAMRTTMIVG